MVHFWGKSFIDMEIKHDPVELSNDWFSLLFVQIFTLTGRETRLQVHRGHTLAREAGCSCTAECMRISAWMIPFDSSYIRMSFDVVSYVVTLYHLSLM